MNPLHSVHTAFGADTAATLKAGGKLDNRYQPLSELLGQAQPRRGLQELPWRSMRGWDVAPPPPPHFDLALWRGPHAQRTPVGCRTVRSMSTPKVLALHNHANGEMR